ncbi:MAG: hypothetical protein HOP33_04535 [Verrucomicrobia bacterium]|nr:hypothetical protein [Verrucomicrobiota bacterium]
MCSPRSLALMFLAGCLGTLSGQAADYTLSQTVLGKTTSLDINTGAGAGLSNWNAGGVNQLNYQWFYYRVGSGGPESPIQNINPTPTTIYNAATRTLDLTYDNGSYSVRTVFQLSGGNTPNLSESITVQNHSGDNLDFHFFQYSDFDLWGLGGGQSVQFFTNSVTGQYYRALQTDGLHTVEEKVNSANPPISHFDAQLANVTLNSLTDGNPTTLSDQVSAGVGNVTFAYQWDVNIANNGSFQISKLLTIVPEPSALSILIMSIAVGRLMRRNNVKS